MPTLPDGARLEQGTGGLQRLTLSSEAAEAHVYLHGGNVTHFRPTGERPLLFLSERSQWQAGAPGKPIRGGVPLCFPWFGPKADVEGAPLHGVARLLPWSLVRVEPAPGLLRASLELAANDYSRRFFPHEFVLRLTVSVSRSLRLSLEVRNADRAAFRFEEALHTYLAVGDVRQLAIEGLEGAGYLDKAGGATRKVQGQDRLTIGGETDRVFTGHSGAVTVSDPAWRRRILVQRSGSSTAVVWNPWQAKAQAMPDFGDEEWPGMLCVEAANALENAVVLEPGASHTLEQTLELLGA